MSIIAKIMKSGSTQRATTSASMRSMVLNTVIFCIIVKNG